MKNKIMKVAILILSALAFCYGYVVAQTENDTEIFNKEIKLNDNCTILLKQISESEYTTQKSVAKRLFYKPYKVITDIAEAMKLLSKKMKFIENDGSFFISEITFEDGSTKQLIWEHDFEAYFPEVNILLFSGGFGGFALFDMNNGDEDGYMVDGLNTFCSNDSRIENPYCHSMSPGNKFRINDADPMDGSEYFIEKWNPEKTKYEIVGYLRETENMSSVFTYATDWFWTSNSKVLFKCGWEGYSYYEMEIIVK
jgi:hypothetical protein